MERTPVNQALDKKLAAKIRLAGILDDPAAAQAIPERERTPAVKAAMSMLLDEIGDLRTALEAAYKDIARLENLADRDTLVGAFNRRAFIRELERVISFGRRYGTVNSIIFFDINGLKKINDTFGHGIGDEALSRVADILSTNIRHSDIVGRLGGDEFAVLLLQSDARQTNQKARDLVAKLNAAPLEHAGRSIAIDAAFGCHTIEASDTAVTALETADKAMYRRKRKQTAA